MSGSEQPRPAPAERPGESDRGHEGKHHAGECERGLERLGLRRRLVPDERVNEHDRLRARESRPEKERDADREEPPRLGLRGARGVADRVGDRARDAAALDRVLRAFRVRKPERASDEEPERQQPQEQSIGEASRENARRNALVVLDGADGDSDGNVPIARARRARQWRAQARARTVVTVRDAGPVAAHRLESSIFGLAHRLFLPLRSTAN